MAQQNNWHQPKLLGKLGRRFFYFFGLSSLIPLIVMMVQGFHCAHRAVHNAAQAHLLSFVENKKKQIVDWLQEREDDVQFLSRVPCLHSCCCDKESFSQDHAENVCNVIETLQRRFPSYERIYVLDLEGNKLVDISENTANSNAQNSHGQIYVEAQSSMLSEHVDQISSGALYKTALQSSKPVFGPLYFEDGLPRMEMACPIPDKEGRPFRMLSIKINMSHAIHKFLSEKAWLGKSGRVIFIGRQGQTIALENEMACSKNHLRQLKEDIISFLNQKLHTGVCPLHHGTIGAYTWIETLDLVIVAEVSWHEAMVDLFLFLKFSLLTAVFTLICIFIIAGIIAKRLSNPILKLALATRKIAEGNLSERVTYEREDEIGMLVHDFNSMCQQLETSHKAMEEGHERLLVAYQKLTTTHHRLVQAESLAATGKTVASIVHEIRNPLSSIKMNLQILSRRLQQEPKYKEHGDIALRELGHMENMLSELLDFSRPVQLQQQRIEMGKLASEAVQSVAAELAKKQIEIRYEIPSDPLYFIGDWQRLKQVFRNLILNAMQASKSHQSVTVRASCIPEKAKIRVEIIDAGEGILEGNMEHLFAPFFTTRENGTGLGLSHAKKIVELHDGNIFVESKRGEGAKFVITLPHLAVFPQ